MSPVNVGRFGTLTSMVMLPWSSFEKFSDAMSAPGPSPTESVNGTVFASVLVGVAFPAGVTEATVAIAAARTSMSASGLVKDQDSSGRVDEDGLGSVGA